MRFLRRLFGCQRYDWMVIHPYLGAGMQALFEELHAGWEIVLSWIDNDSVTILLRKEL